MRTLNSWEKEKNRRIRAKIATAIPFNIFIFNTFCYKTVTTPHGRYF
jgi:hypothetical protein